MSTRLEPPTDSCLFRADERSRAVDQPPRLVLSTRPSTKHSTWSPVPTPIQRASCGPSTSTPCSHGGFTWPAPRLAASSSTTWSPGCCRAGPARHRLPLQSWLRTRSGLLPRRRPLHGGGAAWHAEDHYLDLVVRTGASVELTDVDELMDAVRHGLCDPEARRHSARWTRSRDYPTTVRPPPLAGRQRHGHHLGGPVVSPAMSSTTRGWVLIAAMATLPASSQLSPGNCLVRPDSESHPHLARGAAQHRLPSPSRRGSPRRDDRVPSTDGQVRRPTRRWCRGGRSRPTPCCRPEAGGHAGVDQWPYAANLHCEILVDDAVVAEADQFIAPRLLPQSTTPTTARCSAAAAGNRGGSVPTPLAAAPGARSRRRPPDRRRGCQPSRRPSPTRAGTRRRNHGSFASA